MPFPANLEALHSAGYEYLRCETCPVCGLAIEVYSTPGKRELAFEPMCSSESPATRHYEVCAPKQEEKSGEAAGRGDSEAIGKDHQGDGNQQAEPRSAAQNTERTGGVSSADGSGIKLYGVRDKNMMAVGWQDGTLKVAFRFGTYLYANVAEDAYLKIKANPYPNALFVKLVKNHPELYPVTKVA